MSFVDNQRAALACVLAAALLAGCGGKADKPASPDKPGKPAAGAAAPVSVTTVAVTRRDLPVQLEATGTVVPVASVEVRSQLTSVIREVRVKEGQFVRAGELLFTLDVRTDEANVAKLRAQMARDEAALADARRQLARSRDLLAKNFVSQAGVDSAQAQVDAQTALVAVDRAALDAARVTLDYGRITAPSAGRVGAVSVFPGSAVQANVTTLVTITQLDPIDVAFSVPQRYLADVIAGLKGPGATVAATLPGANAPLTGRLQFVDSSIDAASGAVKVKARFENRDHALWPGAFVKASLTVQTLKDALIVPAAAIVQNTSGSILYTVAEGKAVLRKVTVVTLQGDEAAVTGVSPGDRVVIDGRQNLRPGAAVVEASGKKAP